MPDHASRATSSELGTRNSEPVGQAERQVRENVQGLLGLVSMLIWFAVAFGAAYVLLSNGAILRAPLILGLGAAALLPAALPWLAYRPLIRARLRRTERAG